MNAFRKPVTPPAVEVSENTSSMVAEWVRSDARKEAGYCAPAEVLAERLAVVHFNTLVRLAQCARSDAYTARDGNRYTYIVGFRDNRESASYNAACTALAVAVRRLGFKATVRRPASSSECCSLRVSFPGGLPETAARLHPLYVRALETERAVLARRRGT